MDGSDTRRGQPCWYKRPEVGMTAVNDAILLETCIYTLLHDHFNGQPNYLDTIDAFIYVSKNSCDGFPV
jgi:farnesyl diphosphate synthase